MGFEIRQGESKSMRKWAFAISLSQSLAFSLSSNKHNFFYIIKY